MNEENKIKCEICKREFKNIIFLSNHIRIHNIKTKDYYDKYLIKENENKCLECGKNTNFINLNLGYRKFCSIICVCNNSKIKEKKIKTSQKNYGTEYPSKSKEVKEKYKQTCMKKYGVENISQSEEIKKQKKETSIKNYGETSNLKNKEWREKNKLIMIEKYGVDNIFRNAEYIKKCTLKKLGFDNYSKTPQGKLFHRIKGIKQTEIQKLNGEPLCPNIGPQERKCLNELQIHVPFKIIRNDHDIALIIGRFPDGYISELNLFIQFDEQVHFSDKECKIHKEIDNEVTSQLASHGCIVWRISEFDWKNNKEKVIN